VEGVRKQYADASTQHEYPPVLATADTQTDSDPVPVLNTVSIQTDEIVPPVVDVAEFAAQTDEPPRPASPLRSSIEIQTDEPEPAPAPVQPVEAIEPPAPSTSRHLLDDDEDLASSTTTVRPVSPDPDDLPSYARLEEDSKEKVGLAVLAKWHPHMRSTAPLPNGISREAVEGWETLKTEIGFECMAIEKVVQGSQVREDPPPVTEVVKAIDVPRDPRRWLPYLTLTLGICGICAMALAISARRSAFVRMGVPSYRDRKLWSLYNTLAGPNLEGFNRRVPAFGMFDSIWRFGERLFLGAAEIRRMPT